MNCREPGPGASPGIFASVAEWLCTSLVRSDRKVNARSNRVRGSKYTCVRIAKEAGETPNFAVEGSIPSGRVLRE